MAAEHETIERVEESRPSGMESRPSGAPCSGLTKKKLPCRNPPSKGWKTCHLHHDFEEVSETVPPKIVSVKRTSPVKKPASAHGTKLVSIEAVPGLFFAEAFLSELDEKELLDEIDGQKWSDALSRRTQHYGYEYNYSRRATPLLPTTPMPPKIAALAERVAKLNGLPESLIPDQAILNEYLPGQGISAHIDAPALFGPIVVSITLGGGVTMDFGISGSEPIPVRLSSRSIVVLTGDSRYLFTHSIAKRKSDVVNGVRIPRSRRISITFRSMRKPT